MTLFIPFDSHLKDDATDMPFYAATSIRMLLDAFLGLSDSVCDHRSYTKKLVDTICYN